jgi:4-hydroxybenzoate polyprenyltransferase
MLAASCLLTSSLALVNSNYLYSLPVFIAAHVFLKMELNKIDIKNKESCNQFFKKNNIFGLLIFVGLLIKRLVDESQMEEKPKE